MTNYLRAAWRHFTREKGFTTINMAGLALGLAACLFITLFVVDEYSYDRYNAKADRIFRIAADLNINGGAINDVATPPAMAAALVKDFPAVEKAVRIRAMRQELTVHIDDKLFLESSAALADSNFFDIFTLPLLAGDPHTALAAPNALVLSKTAAQKYFNTTDVLGKTLRLDEDTALYVVTGVMRDMPQQSHFHFHLVRSLQQRRQEWINLFAATYILVRPGTTTADIDRMLKNTVDKYIAPQIREQLHNNAADLQRNGDHFRYYAIPLTRIHLYSNRGGEFEANGNSRYVILFTIAAVLILLMACVNFINLATARSMRRTREIGVRKVLGSGRRRLIWQFLVESILLTAMAMTLALVLVWILLPWFDKFSGRHFDVSVLVQRWTIPSLLLATLVVGLLSGSYPAFLLSGVQPLKILRGQLTAGLRAGVLRTPLLVFQFSIAMILIIGTAVIATQLHYIRHRELGYTREQVLTVKNTRALGDNAYTFAKEARQLPGVMDATVSGSLPDQKVIFRGFFKDQSGKETVTVLLGDWLIDSHYLHTLDIKIAAGRNFSQLATDANNVLINQSAARALGYVQPVGEKIYTGTDSADAHTIIGVVKDFNTGSLHNPIDPVVFRLGHDGSAVIFRMAPGDITATLGSIRRAYQSVANGHPFMYTFLDDDFNRLYVADERTGRLFTAFSILALFIAGMGIFGLVTAAAEQRTKELGIRRVLGARVFHLMLLLCREYGLALTVAVLIAVPAGAWLMHSWLQEFAYRTQLQPWIFLAAPLCAIILTMLIVGVKAGQASLGNPAKALRTE